MNKALLNKIIIISIYAKYIYLKKPDKIKFASKYKSWANIQKTEGRGYTNQRREKYYGRFRRDSQCQLAENSWIWLRNEICSERTYSLNCSHTHTLDWWDYSYKRECFLRIFWNMLKRDYPFCYRIEFI